MSTAGGLSLLSSYPWSGQHDWKAIVRHIKTYDRGDLIGAASLRSFLVSFVVPRHRTAIEAAREAM